MDAPVPIGVEDIMCGISGYFLRERRAFSSRRVESLLRPIRARRPDDEGVYCAVRGLGEGRRLATDRTIEALSGDLQQITEVDGKFEHDLTLAHTRYSIIDLSTGGHQPFVAGNGGITAVFNGEIYNYVELREELMRAGISFRTASDTEVLVEGFRYWRDDLWNKLNGFFAVALHDSTDGTVTLARDRFGVAPLYYTETEEGFFFSSSIRALLGETRGPVEIDRERVLGFIQTSLKDFDGGTFFSAVQAFPRASFARFATGVWAFDRADVRTYWSLPSERWSVDDLSFEEAVARYRETFFDAVDLRMRADVDVAFELSGGLDSSSVVAAAAELRNSAITTFTIRVPGSLNEEPYARAILERYPVDYRVLDEPESHFFDEVSEFAALMEEPYHSPNIYTHFKMRQEMKAQGFSVVLSGSGGDEVLAGYSAFDERARSALCDVGMRWYARRHALARRVFDQGLPRAVVGALRRAGRDCLDSMRLSNADAQAALDPGPCVTSALEQQRRFAGLSFQEQVRYHFQVGLLPYYMASNDHFTMGVPVEHRFPFLDFRMVELGLQLPVPYLFRNGYSKYILRRAMEPYLPKRIVWRKRKMGFPFDHRRFLSTARPKLAPFLRWLEPLALFGGEMLDADALLETDPVRLWRSYCTGIWLSEVVGDR